jgi:hypothetical protein
LGVDALTLDTRPSPVTDYHASMIEVADVLFSQTGCMPYGARAEDHDCGYLKVSTALVDYWKRWLDEHCPAGPKGCKIRVGINWQGNPQHHADVYRSVPLAVFQPLAEMPGVQLINLQFGHGTDQLDQHAFASSIFRLPDDVDSQSAFTDTAAILASLDHVVTTDTAIAHLAGAVGGVPVHLILGQIPDWRWLLDGERSPWYPTMQLYRQTKFGHWDEVIAKIRRAIAGEA